MGEYIGLWVRDVRLDFWHGLIPVHFGISRINLSRANDGSKCEKEKIGGSRQNFYGRRDNHFYS